MNNNYQNLQICLVDIVYYILMNSLSKSEEIGDCSIIMKLFRLHNLINPAFKRYFVTIVDIGFD